MRLTSSCRQLLLLALLAGPALPCGGQGAKPAPPALAPPPPVPPVPPKPGASPLPIPEDLVGDEHIREEFGVNEFTTPSIRKIFGMLDSVGKLSYDNLKRPLARNTPTDRVLVSLGLGSLIADGFLVVQCEKLEAMEDVGRALIKYAKVLGTGQRMNRHTQSLFEHSISGEWNRLREELARTQADVEAEMLQLRDVDMAHLVSLGGWARAFEIAARSVADHYEQGKTKALMRRDLVDYFLSSLESLSPELQKHQALVSMAALLQKMPAAMGSESQQSLSQPEVQNLAERASELARWVTDPMQESGPGRGAAKPQGKP